VKRAIQLGGLGLCAYLVFLISSVPAGFVLGQLPPEVAGVVVGVRGTVWSGEAASLTVQGVDLGRLEWSTSPFAALIGRASADVAVRGRELNSTARITAHPGGDVFVRDLQARTTPRLIDQFQPLPAELSGDLALELDTLSYQSGALTDVNGELRWTNAAITAPYELALGQYTLALETRDDAIRGSLTEQGSPLRTSGNFMLQRASGEYRLAVRLTPREETPQELRDLLGLLGKTDRSGGVTLRHQGIVPGLRPGG
jgi:hypothetical protein